MIRYAGIVAVAMLVTLAACGKKGDPVAPKPQQDQAAAPSADMSAGGAPAEAGAKP